MRKFLTCAAAAASAIVITAFAGAGPAAAQVVGARTAANLATSPALVTQVQWRGRGGWRGGWGCRWGCGWRGGWWVPGAVVGGAIVGSAIAAGAYAPYPYPPGPYYAPGPYPAEAETAEAAPDGDATAYCMQRFHSYDPRTGTYLGYDGHRHPCP